MMSTLQISLAIGGGLVLAGVVAHGAWTARKSLPKQATPPPAPHGALSPASAQGLASSSGDPAADAFAQRQEPSFEADSGMSSLTQLTTPERKPGLDILIDALAAITLESAVSGEAALAVMPSTRRVGSKPFGVEGLSVSLGEWEYPQSGHRYSAFQCGVQLANRTGALNQIEYSEFVIKAQAFADAVGGAVEFAEMLDEVARARELDQFAGAHDAQISITVRATRTAWSPGYVQQSAAGQGFVSSLVPGRMVLPASQPGQSPILILVFDPQAAMAEDPEQTALREFSVLLDVPQVPRIEQPFACMCDAALKLAASMDGVIVDEEGHLIRAADMEGIHADLEQLYDRMDEREMSAGSVLGRRLFS